MEDVHVTGAETIAQAAKENGVNHFIHVSALNAKPGAESKYYQVKVSEIDATNSLSHTLSNFVKKMGKWEMKCNISVSVEIPLSSVKALK